MGKGWKGNQINNLHQRNSIHCRDRLNGPSLCPPPACMRTIEHQDSQGNQSEHPYVQYDQGKPEVRCNRTNHSPNESEHHYRTGHY